MASPPPGLGGWYARIVSHNDVEPSFRHGYRDGGHPDDIRTFHSPAMIEKIIYTGDTYGDEAGTRTQAQIFFRELRVDVEECGESSPTPPPG